MNEEENTVEVQIDGATYHLRPHLGWYEIDSISTAGMRMFIDGKLISQGADIEDLDSLEVELDAGVRNLRRLSSRLVGLKPFEVKKLPRAHIVQLLAKCDELEAAEDAELGDLAPKASITTHSKQLLETASSSE
jgi:hypothetical protein